MATTASPAGAPRRGRWSRVLAGCVIGCAGLVVLAVVLVVGVVRWAARATPLAAEDALLVPEVNAALAVTADLADPPTRAFIQVMFRDAAHEAPSPAAKAFPIRFLATLSGEPPRPLGMLCLSRFSNLISLSLLPFRLGAKDDSQVSKYRDEVVIGDKGATFAFAGGNLVVSSSMEAVRGAIDRLKDRDGGRPNPRLAALWPRGPSPVKLAATSEGGSLLSAWRFLDKLLLDPRAPRAELVEDVLGRASGARLVAAPGPVAPESLSGTLTLVFPEGAESALAGLERLGPELAAGLAARGVEPRATLRVAGAEVIVEFELKKLASALSGSTVRIGPVEVK